MKTRLLMVVLVSLIAVISIAASCERVIDPMSAMVIYQDAPGEIVVWWEDPLPNGLNVGDHILATHDDSNGNFQETEGLFLQSSSGEYFVHLDFDQYLIDFEDRTRWTFEAIDNPYTNSVELDPYLPYFWDSPNYIVISWLPEFGIVPSVNDGDPVSAIFDDGMEYFYGECNIEVYKKKGGSGISCYIPLRGQNRPGNSTRGKFWTLTKL